MIKRIFPILFLLMACEPEEVERLDYADISLVVESGTDQSFIRGRLSDEPITIKSVDKNGNSIPNIPIAWVLNPQNTFPSTTISPFSQSDWGPYLYAEYVTDKNGLARCYLKVPSGDTYSTPSAEGNQMLEVRVTDPEKDITSYDKLLLELNTLDKTYSYDLEIVSGDKQKGKILLRADRVIKLKLLENDDESVWDYHVTFTSESTGWNLTADTENFNEPITGDNQIGFSTITDGNGEIAFYWFFGGEPGVQTLYVNIFTSGGEHLDGSPFAITADVADLDVSLKYIEGKTQSATATTGLPTPLTVQLIDENQEPVSGYEIKWETTQGHSVESLHGDDLAQTISSSLFSTRSDDDGFAKARLITGTTVGNFEALAHVYNGEGIEVSGSPIIFDYSTFAKGQFTDPRDNQTYSTITINDATWFGENLNYHGGNSVCYNNLSTFCDEFGALYTWNEAKTSCPSGWHTPSDQEWKNLETYLGMEVTELDKWGSRANVNDLGLLEGQWSGLNFLAGGYFSIDVFTLNKRLNEYGHAEFQWTSDQFDESGIMRYFGDDWGFSYVKRNTVSAPSMCSVRCVAD